MEEILKCMGYIEEEERDESEDFGKCCWYCAYRNRSMEECFCRRSETYVDSMGVCNIFVDYYETPKGKEEVARGYRLFNGEEKNSSHEEGKNSSQSSEGCYIATAVYGGYDMPEVLVLRKFRDEILKKNFFGRIFIKIYYALSPKAAEKLKSHKWINGKVKCILDKFVSRLLTSSIFTP